jgi:hypothetical protein
MDAKKLGMQKNRQAAGIDVCIAPAAPHTVAKPGDWTMGYFDCWLECLGCKSSANEKVEYADVVFSTRR